MHLPWPFYEYGNDLKKGLNRKMRAPWALFAPVREATDQLTDQDLRVHLSNSKVLPALCYAAVTWAGTVAKSRKLLITRRALERSLLKDRRTLYPAGFRSSEQCSVFAIQQNIFQKLSTVGDAKCPRGRPPTRWGNVTATRMDQQRAQLDKDLVNVAHET
ncbi:hypothetical protein RB195_021300 [Necator americanus]|uniref:Uncharacterized protein n=1 Tax=Necator americanus TaxID=51031 RepID=A0ABR1EAB1_NECAM